MFDRPATPPLDPGSAGQWASEVPHSTLAALLAGFGFGTLAALSGSLAGWPVAGLAIGLIHRGERLAGAMGIVLAAVAMGTLASGTAPSPPAEYSGIGPTITVIGVLALFVLMPVVVALAGLLARSGGGHRVLAVASGIGGCAALAVVVATSTVLMATPAVASFALDLPDGWHALAAPPLTVPADPLFGIQFTAVHGEAPTAPTTGALTGAATIGVSVFDLPRTSGCPRDTEGWPGSDSAVYHGTDLGGPAPSLPRGASSHVRRAVDPPGSRIDVIGFSRVRHVLLVDQSLCYILVVRSPAGDPVDPAIVDALVTGFRFR
jgi:hypothetical protein